jgi:inorganic triphosphatase YgiF
MIGAKNTLDTVLVKAPHRKETFSEQELEDFEG